MFRERIKKAYENLTPSFKRLADFILNNELDVAFMTATELANALGVDAATVVRFSQTLGYSGYRELAREIKRRVKEDLTAAYAKFPEAETDAERLQALLEHQRHTLGMAVAQVSEEAAQIVEMLARAERVWVVGEATGESLASLFADYLRMAGINAAVLHADPARAAFVVKDLGPGDLVVGIGVTGTGVNTAAVLRAAQEKKAQVAVISVSLVTPPAQVTDHVLVCPAQTPMGVPSIANLVAAMMAIWQALLARDEEQLEAHITALHRTYADLLSKQAEESKRGDIYRVWREF
ncbi:MAG TPA: MurR/RpiR family transcriptional regulator [Thermoflexia bacterium]|jgi:DNA-binding MurR/RpiR family transcriptional regulator|nr:MurR/RpiR family transcriptional regulator [Thermoflexia bacterium]